MVGYRMLCPKCKSENVHVEYPGLRCYACGHSDELVDYPVSWDTHRFYAYTMKGRDPGPNLPEESPADEAVVSPKPKYQVPQSRPVAPFKPASKGTVDL